MPLNSAALSSDLQSLFEGYPDSASECADGIASAYASYAITGVFGPSTIPSLAPQQSALSSAILGGLNAQSSSAVANAFVSGITAFWVGVTTTLGPTIGCPGASGLSALQAHFDSLPSSAADSASGIADLLNTATLTVTALITIPPAGPVVTPIS